MKIEDMDAAQTRAAAEEILNRVSGDLTGEDADRFQQLQDRAAELRRADAERAATLAEIRAAATGEGRFRVVSGAPEGRHDPADAPRQRDTALRTLDRAVADDRLAAAGAELVERMMHTGPGPAQTWTRRYAAAAGAPAYERAFGKLIADPDRGHLTWTPEESEAYRQVSAVASEQRAMAVGSGATGGYMVPLTLDPAILLTSNGSVNPLRELARVVQTTTNTWQGVTSAGVTAEWKAEGDEAADASPTLDDAPIPVHLGDAFVPFSFEVQSDAPNFMGELGKLLTDAADQLTAAAYTTGTGSGQPKGVITSLVAAAGTVPLIAPATAETLAAADVFAVQNALPPRFQPNAAWCANLAIINALRQFETSNGALKFPELAEGRLLGRGMYENSNMDGSINPTATETNYPLIYGDFAAGMVVVDRIGSTLELVPHLVGANGRPTGQRGALLWFRTGSDVVNPNAC